MKFLARVTILGLSIIILFSIFSYQKLKSTKDVSTTDDNNIQDGNFLVITVATKKTRTYQQLIRSARVNGIPLKTLGMGEIWKGFGHKLLLVREELERHKDASDRIILFVDAYDVLINDGVEQILQRFQKFDARVVFSAEANCWPDEDLKNKYPPIAEGKRFLNSGMYIGYAPELYHMITSSPLNETVDDQRFFTKIYLDDHQRGQLKFKLDHFSDIFQNMDGHNDVQIRFDDGKEAYILNKKHGSIPAIIHTPGYCKFLLDVIGNYIPKIWKPEGGCAACLEDTIDLTKIQADDFPLVVIGVFIDETPSMNEFLDRLHSLNYPKKKIHLYIDNHANKTQVDLVRSFLDKYGNEYKSVRSVDSSVNNESPVNRTRKDIGIGECVRWKCDFYLNLDSVARLDNRDTLRLLVEQNRPVVAPMLFGTRKGQRNFHGLDTTSLHCPDSIEVVKNPDRGLLSVGVVTSCYLIRGDVILDPKTKPSYVLPDDVPLDINSDILFSDSMSGHDIDLFASNRYDFGHLLL